MAAASGLRGRRGSQQLGAVGGEGDPAQRPASEAGEDHNFIEHLPEIRHDEAASGLRGRRGSQPFWANTATRSATGSVRPPRPARITTPSTPSSPAPRWRAASGLRGRRGSQLRDRERLLGVRESQHPASEAGEDHNFNATPVTQRAAIAASGLRGRRGSQRLHRHVLSPLMRKQRPASEAGEDHNPMYQSYVLGVACSVRPPRPARITTRCSRRGGRTPTRSVRPPRPARITTPSARPWSAGRWQRPASEAGEDHNFSGPGQGKITL